MYGLERGNGREQGNFLSWTKGWPNRNDEEINNQKTMESEVKLVKCGATITSVSLELGRPLMYKHVQCMEPFKA